MSQGTNLKGKKYKSTLISIEHLKLLILSNANEVRMIF